MVGMEKIKIVLTILSIVIVVGPLAGVALLYRDNLSGLVFPPEVSNLENGQIGNVTVSDFVAPAIAGEPQYDPDTGALNVSLSFTNPLNNEISVDQFKADIKSKDQNIELGNVELAKPISIAPGENGIVDVIGNLSPELIKQIQTQYQDNGKVNIVFENIDAVVAGVSFHLDSFDAGSIQLPR